MRSGLSVGLGGSVNEFNTSSNVGPLYHGIFGDALMRLSPFQPDTGTNLILVISYPTTFSSDSSSFVHSLNLSSEKLTVESSILLIATASCATPRVLAR